MTSINLCISLCDLQMAGVLRACCLLQQLQSQVFKLWQLAGHVEELASDVASALLPY